MIDPARIKAHAAKFEGQNLKFRTFLKNHADDDELDAQFLALHHELFQSYDCCKCNNCCKSYNVSVKPDEVNIIAAFLGATEATEADVISQYLEKDADDETGEDCYAIKSKPCPFLCSDGKCRVQSCKPATCKGYPFTDKPDRLSSMYAILGFAEQCPVVFEMLERLKRAYRFRTR